ncbi:uncharacterized protein LOC124349668 isoform X3 [Daphnia pulicaria]|uniref:uncharacterized protein LOC124349668 isoform X3 n=1 Tax=Daphnia pulicaria TaxID=35523 RepID=UPI001EEAD748|nr:uncharacterized protein LOC124349668 isoform X3 [Daphnia pulicaria]
MSFSGRSFATEATNVVDLAGEQLPTDLSPPVSRSEVLEVFDSWRNSAAGSSNADSGIDQVYSSSSTSGTQPSPTKKKEGRPAIRKRNSKTETTGVMNNQGGVNANHKLPRIGNKKPSRQSTMHSLISPPAMNNVDEKRRFVTVVRPLSVFPEPALPPNYTPHMVQQYNPVQRGRPPSPAPFPPQQQRQQMRPGQRNTGNSNFSLAGQGVSSNGYHGGGPGSASLRVNLAGGSGWDLTAIKRGYNNVGYATNYKSTHDRSMENGARYQSQNALDQEISMPPWNPHFGYSKVLSQQNLPLTDDWRRHIDARRKALQRRRTKRRGVADGGNNFGASGDRFYNGAAQTDGNFEELLRRAGDVESSVQTDPAIESVKRSRAVNGSSDVISSLNSNTQDNSTQVILSDLPDFETGLAPIVEQLVNVTLEQAFVEMLEEEEIKEIRQQRIQFQQLKMAELTTSKLMNVATD